MAAHKKDPFATYDDTHIRHMQVVYLHEIVHEANNKIAEITNYAISTVRNYAKKFMYLLKEAKDFFYYACGTCSIHDKFLLEENCAYVIELCDNENDPIFLKVGKTDNVKRRMLQLRKKYGLIPNVKMIFPCEDAEDALIMESALRKSYKEQYPQSFVPNDRFQYVSFDIKDIKQSKYVKSMYEFLGYDQEVIIY